MFLLLPLSFTFSARKFLECRDERMLSTHTHIKTTHTPSKLWTQHKDRASWHGGAEWHDSFHSRASRISAACSAGFSAVVECSASGREANSNFRESIGREPKCLNTEQFECRGIAVLQCHAPRKSKVPFGKHNHQRLPFIFILDLLPSKMASDALGHQGI